MVGPLSTTKRGGHPAKQPGATITVHDAVAGGGGEGSHHTIEDEGLHIFLELQSSKSRVSKLRRMYEAEFAAAAASREKRQEQRSEL